MAETLRRTSNLNSLWSILYCILALVVHSYITYLGVKKYRKLDNNVLWGGDPPPELRAFIALIVLSILFLPVFVFCSFLKLGNTANDGEQLGRDHAIDCHQSTLGTKIRHDTVRQLWQKFPPFSPVLQLLSAFLVLVPEVILKAAEVRYGLTPSDAVWSSDLDFMFAEDRAMMSNIVAQSNLTVQANLSFYVVPTSRPPVGGWTREPGLQLAFVYLVAGLIAYSVKYASVFWFTNKVYSAIFAFQLMFMTVEAIFAHCAMALLYSFSVNYERYEQHLTTALGSEIVLFLHISSGFVLLFSTFFLYNYGAEYFHEKFKVLDKRHHPETYRKEAVVVTGTCQGHKTHTFAMVSLVLMAILKGPMIYDLVTIYKVTKDSLSLTCIIIGVCYMVEWVILWTILTLKQKWQFRILDYIPITQPVFMISNENLVKSASFHGGSVDLSEHLAVKKRPSSLPSELTTSESGFGDANSSDDDRERFEITLPTLVEVPGDLISSRRKGSTHSLDRRSRGRRNGNQRVTFHETVKRCTSTDDELYNQNHRSRRDMVNVTAVDVHRQAILARQMARSESADSRCSTPIELEVVLRRPGSRHSIDVTSPSRLNNVLFNHRPLELIQDDSAKAQAGAKAVPKETNKNERPMNYKDLTIKNDYAYGDKSNFKSSNIQTQTALANGSDETGTLNTQSSSEGSATINMDDGKTQVCTPSKGTNKAVPNNLKTEPSNRNRLSPRTIEFIDRKHDIGLNRRDSANYSLTSSQETASNDSDHNHQALCSQVKTTQT